MPVLNGWWFWVRLDLYAKIIFFDFLHFALSLLKLRLGVLRNDVFVYMMTVSN